MFLKAPKTGADNVSTSKLSMMRVGSRPSRVTRTGTHAFSCNVVGADERNSNALTKTLVALQHNSIRRLWSSPGR